MSVSNGFAAQGLNILAQMMEAAGPSRKDNATAFAAESARLAAGIKKQMWNTSSNMYCDGVCAEVGGASKLMTNMFMLAFGLVPQEHVAQVVHGLIHTHCE